MWFIEMVRSLFFSHYHSTFILRLFINIQLNKQNISQCKMWYPLHYSITGNNDNNMIQLQMLQSLLWLKSLKLKYKALLPSTGCLDDKLETKARWRVRVEGLLFIALKKMLYFNCQIIQQLLNFYDWLKLKLVRANKNWVDHKNVNIWLSSWSIISKGQFTPYQKYIFRPVMWFVFIVAQFFEISAVKFSFFLPV